MVNNEIIIGIAIGTMILQIVIFYYVLGIGTFHKNIRRIKIMLEAMNAKNGIDPKTMYDRYEVNYIYDSVHEVNNDDKK